jgi:hypothetical protein
MKNFLAMYQIGSIISDINFKQFINRKKFHLQFNYAELKK